MAFSCFRNRRNRPLCQHPLEKTDRARFELAEGNAASSRFPCEHHKPLGHLSEGGCAGKNRTSNEGAYETPQPAKACPRKNQNRIEKDAHHSAARKADESNAIGFPTFGFQDHPRPSRVSPPHSTPGGTSWKDGRPERAADSPTECCPRFLRSKAGDSS